CCFFFQADDGIRGFHVTGVQTCALPIFCSTKQTFFICYCYIFSSVTRGSSNIRRKWLFRCTRMAFRYCSASLFFSTSTSSLWERSEERRVGKECRLPDSCSHRHEI